MTIINQLRVHATAARLFGAIALTMAIVSLVAGSVSIAAKPTHMQINREPASMNAKAATGLPHKASGQSTGLYLDHSKPYRCHPRSDYVNGYLQGSSTSRQ